MPNQVAFGLVPGNFPVYFFSIHWQLSLSLLPFTLLFFVTCGYQKAAGCHMTASFRDSSRAPYPRAVPSHIPGLVLYPLGLCFRDRIHGHSQGWLAFLLNVLHWEVVAIHLSYNSNLSGYISLSEETLKIVLTIATALQIQQDLLLPTCHVEPSHPHFRIRQMTSPAELLRGGVAWCFDEETTFDHVCLHLPPSEETQNLLRKKRALSFDVPL